MPNYRVSLAFGRASDGALGDIATAVIAGLSTGSTFPAPPVNTTLLAEQRDTYLQKLAAAMNGGTLATAEKNAARAVLMESLRQDASYVQTIASQDLAALLSSGYQARNTNSTQSVLPKPIVDKAENFQSSKLRVRLQPIRNLKAVEVQRKNGSGDWQPAGIFTQSRRIVQEGLTPGGTYSFQFRGIGGSTGYSDWSDPLVQMVL